MSNPNLALSRRWVEEVWNQGLAATIDELFHPEGVTHCDGGDVHGIEAYKRLHAVFLAAFPDLRVAIEGAVAEGDEVAIRWHATATHDGDGLGMRATHQAVSYRGMTWYRYRDGKLIEGWVSWNQAALFQRLQQAARERREVPDNLLESSDPIESNGPTTSPWPSRTDS
jgi:steroid delta-isomerase-like uncharacterized protein